jgi:hypothetical protein
VCTPGRSSISLQPTTTTALAAAAAAHKRSVSSLSTIRVLS